MTVGGFRDHGPSCPDLLYLQFEEETVQWAPVTSGPDRTWRSAADAGGVPHAARETPRRELLAVHWQGVPHLRARRP